MKKRYSLLMRIVYTLFAAAIILAAVTVAVIAVRGIKGTGGSNRTGAPPTTGLLMKLPENPGVTIFAPNQQYVDTSYPGVSYRVRINSYGLRGPDYPRKKPKGTARIVLLGDSFVFGTGVDDGNTLDAKLEQLLEGRNAAHRFHVINGGIGGSTITDEMALYEGIARGFDPDIVVLEYSWNDMLDLIARMENVPMKPQGGKRPTPLFRFMFEHVGAARSAAYRKAEKRKRELMSEFRNKTGGIDWNKQVETIPLGENLILENAVSLYKDSLLKFSKQLSSQGVGFVFFINPTKIDGNLVRRDVGAELEAFAVRNGIPTLNLRPLWLADHADIDSFFDTTVHPNEEAVEFTAAKLLKLMEKHRMLK